MKIMHIEDDYEYSYRLRIGLARFGYTVEHFVSSIDAMKTIRQNPEKYAIVICDGNPGEFEGRSVVNEIKETNPNIRIIAQSNVPDLIEEMVQAGAEGFGPRSTKEDDLRALNDLILEIKRRYG